MPTINIHVVDMVILLSLYIYMYIYLYTCIYVWSRNTADHHDINGRLKMNVNSWFLFISFCNKPKQKIKQKVMVFPSESRSRVRRVWDESTFHFYSDVCSAGNRNRPTHSWWNESAFTFGGQVCVCVCMRVSSKYAWTRQKEKSHKWKYDSR